MITATTKRLSKRKYAPCNTQAGVVMLAYQNRERKLSFEKKRDGRYGWMKRTWAKEKTK